LEGEESTSLTPRPWPAVQNPLAQQDLPDSLRNPGFPATPDENRTCKPPCFLCLKSHSLFQSYRAILPTSLTPILPKTRGY